LVNLAKSWFTVAFPEYWLFFLGLMFVVVTLWLPQGIVGLYTSVVRRLRAPKVSPREAAA
jgi:urea transport system permease protein